MSKTPKDKSIRNIASSASQQDDSSDLYDDSYDDEEQEYIPQRRPRSKAQPQQQPQSYRQGSANYRPRSVPPQRSLNTGYMVIFGTLGVLIFAGAILIAFLLGSRTGPSSVSQSAATVPTVASDTSSQAADTYPEVPRIEVTDFAKLYNDMSKRPYLIDVRSKDQYDEEHIKGAILFPTDQVSAKVSSLPKDKLIVAYCA